MPLNSFNYTLYSLTQWQTKEHDIGIPKVEMKKTVIYILHRQLLDNYFVTKFKFRPLWFFFLRIKY